MIEERLNILIIDDDKVDSALIKKSFKKADLSANFLEATSVGDAVKLVSENNTFDFIFLDYKLPDADGIEFIYKAKELKISTPIIMITSQGDETVAVKALKAGATDYIPKSLLSPEGITQIIRNQKKLHLEEMKRKEVEKKLSEVQNSLNLIISNTPIIIFSIDKELIFTLFRGQGLEKIYDIKGEFIGKSVIEVCKDYPRILNNVKKAFEGNSFKDIIEIDQHYFETYYSYFKNDLGEVINIFGVSTDITDLVKTKELAERNAKVKQTFLANISHEIRTPINAVIGFSELLSKSSNFDTEQSFYVKAVKDSANNLLALVNGILDLSKMEAGKMTFEITEFSLKDLLDSLKNIFSLKIKEKNLDLNVIIDEKIPEIILGDPHRFNQIFFNLISNAIKFTEKGYIELRLNLLEMHEDKIKLQIILKDTGIGISPEKHDSVFYSFTQANDDTTRKYGGTGLGLTIVKNLVELLGGTIRVESEPEKGTEFFINFYLGLPRASRIKESKVKSIEEYSNIFSALKILIVEDEILNQILIKKILKDANIYSEIAENGVEAIEKLEKNDYSLILMDMNLPVMDGIETTIKIRQMESSKKNIPIIAMTANAFIEQKEKCFAAGMNDFLTKPIRIEELFKKLDPFLVKNKTQ